MHSLVEADLQILDSLLQGKGDAFDFEPSVVAESVQRLNRQGCQIIQHPNATYQLIECALEVWSDYLTARLCCKPRRTVEVYRQTASTQDIAKHRAQEHLAILADEQTAGRGRLGRTWTAPSGAAVLMSLTFALDGKQHRSLDRLALVAAVAVAQAIEQLTGHPLVHVKWPNDLIVNGRKIAGILIETTSSHNAAIIGIGINVALTREQLAALPVDIRDKTTSFVLCGWQEHRLRVAAVVIDAIDQLMANPHPRDMVDQWRRRSVLHDGEVCFCTDGHQIIGTAIDLDPDDGLIVRRTTGELIHLHAATTTIV